MITILVFLIFCLLSIPYFNYRDCVVSECVKYTILHMIEHYSMSIGFLNVFNLKFSVSFSWKYFGSQIFAFMDVEKSGVITFKQVIEHSQPLSRNPRSCVR